MVSEIVAPNFWTLKVSENLEKLRSDLRIGSPAQCAPLQWGSQMITETSIFLKSTKKSKNIFLVQCIQYIRRNALLMPKHRPPVRRSVLKTLEQYGNTGCGVFKRGIQN